MVKKALKKGSQLLQILLIESLLCDILDYSKIEGFRGEKGFFPLGSRDQSKNHLTANFTYSNFSD